MTSYGIPDDLTCLSDSELWLWQMEYELLVQHADFPSLRARKERDLRLIEAEIARRQA